MATNVGQRHIPDTPANERCLAVDACKALWEHTSHITAQKRFTDHPEAEDVRQHVRALALSAFEDAYVANEQNVDKDPALARKRQENQTGMLECLERMPPAIQASKKAFHIEASSIEYWCALAFTALDMAKKWYRRDRGRYPYQSQL